MRIGLWTVVVLAVEITASAAGAQQPMQDTMPGMQMGHDRAAMAKPAVPTGVLRLTFDGKSTDWTLAQLAALPHKTITVFNSHAKANQTYSGVPLMDLLAKAGVPTDLHGHDLALYLAAVGSDGYIAAYAVAEVNPLTHEGAVLVADAMDGRPLGTTGPLMMVDSGDKKPSRWVRNLVQVKVQTAQ